MKNLYDEIVKILNLKNKTLDDVETIVLIDDIDTKKSCSIPKKDFIRMDGTVVEFEDSFELTEDNIELVVALSKNNNLPVTLVCGNKAEMYFNGKRVNKI